MMTCAPFAKSPNCASHMQSRFGIVQRVAVVEAEHAGFAEQRVVDAELRLARVDILERAIAFARLLIVEIRVALAEGAAPAILPAEPHGDAFEQQRAHGERLARTTSRTVRRSPTTFARLSSRKLFSFG